VVAVVEQTVLIQQEQVVLVAVQLALTLQVLQEVQDRLILVAVVEVELIQVLKMVAQVVQE
jgi:hypothetical protein